MTEGAQEWRAAHLEKGAHCPWCGQYAKIYRRKLNSGMAYALCCFYRYYRREWGLIVHEDGRVQRRWGGDPAKLFHWGLLEPAESPHNRKRRRAGLWRVTQRGQDWVRERITVPRYAVIYDGHLLRLEGDPTNVRAALADHFDLDELMRDT
jgi:hypothetical protein